ncbi:two-component response regulator ORR22-like [Dioscorea cayenensis subsp. rotundata]|uniref:Two-component response regulator ORR22-like n=1 Tax=Dioscorea cayennensis subsp. rotundata TaxID=55577 RepID=A0AB40CUL4_DIOCR|nr:two-component response regulator ORR22-like [Dioscorea cayenensis subsp. rotundata]
MNPPLTNFGASYAPQPHKINNPVNDIQPKYKDGFLMETQKFQGSFNSNASNGLLDVVIKPDLAEAAFMDGDIGCDMYSLGACM